MGMSERLGVEGEVVTGGRYVVVRRWLFCLFGKGFGES